MPVRSSANPGYSYYSGSQSIDEHIEFHMVKSADIEEYSQVKQAFNLFNLMHSDYEN